MLDLERLEHILVSRYPAQWVRHHLASFPAAYFSSFEVSDIARHLARILRLTEDRLVVVQPRPADENEWWVEVIGYDAFQFLSTLCALLALRGLSIVEGVVFTSQPPPPGPLPSRPPFPQGTPVRHPPRRPGPSGPGRRPTIVDVLRVRQNRAEDGPPDWDHFQEELTTLTRLLLDGRHDEVNHRLIARFAAALRRVRLPQEDLEPIDLTIDSEASDVATRVRIGKRDRLGFLSLTAEALALCGIRIVQAEIRTGGGRVQDTLWVTDRRGNPITAPAQLRELRLSLILIEHFSDRLPEAIDPEAALVHFSRFVTDSMARPNWAEEFEALDRPDVLDALVRLLGESHFLWEEHLQTQPNTFFPLVCHPNEWRRRPQPAALATELKAELDASPTPEERCRTLQQFRDREIFRADLRSILGLNGGLESFSAELTDVAEVLLRAALSEAARRLEREPPRGRDGRDLAVTLCALGKFGGRELGFASDLELMLIYDDRQADPSPDERGVGDYFDALLSGLRAVLGSRQGRTFDLDFRLRPYGRSGAPATALTSFHHYYRADGAAWGYERQALIKLRAIGGDAALGREVEESRDQFVFGPEPFDLAGFERLRRRQIEQLVRPGTINAKYSPGALVDVEYFVQALQISHGRDHPSLRSPHTLKALAALGVAGFLASQLAEELGAAYRFFRALVDALRVVRGHAQDLVVPPAGSEEFERLARRLRLADSAGLRSELDARLESTRRVMDRLGEFLGGTLEGTKDP